MLSLSYCEMQTNANEMKPIIIPPSYPPSLANLLPKFWVTGLVYATFSKVYDIDQDWFVSQVGPADLDAFDCCSPDNGQ